MNADNFLNFKTASEHLATRVFPKRTWENNNFKKILSEETLIEDASEIYIAISNLFQLVLLANQKNKISAIIFDSLFIESTKIYNNVGS